MAGQQSLVIAVDLGGTRIRAALSNTEGQFLHRVECLTEADQGRDAVLNRLVGLIEEVHQKASPNTCMGIGIGTPGPIDPRDGVILSAPNLPGWSEVPLQAIIEERVGLPVRLANDANAAVLGEWAFGAGQGRENLIYITISTGVGGGMIVDGRLILGLRGLAGEVGHMTLQADGPRCNCGNYGCWEALSSGTAIARDGAEAVRNGQSSWLIKLSQGDPERVDARLVGQAAHQGDGAAMQIIRQAARYSGIGVANLLHLFSPEIVLIGGGVSNLGDIFFEPLRRTAFKRVMPAYRNVPIVRAALGPDVGLLGAVALFRTEDLA